MDLLVGIGNALSFENLIYAFVGSFLGTLVGVLPGLGPVSAMAILFPFINVLPPDALIIVMSVSTLVASTAARPPPSS